VRTRTRRRFIFANGLVDNMSQLPGLGTADFAGKNQGSIDIEVKGAKHAEGLRMGHGPDIVREIRKRVGIKPVQDVKARAHVAVDVVFSEKGLRDLKPERILKLTKALPTFVVFRKQPARNPKNASRGKQTGCCNRVTVKRHEASVIEGDLHQKTGDLPNSADVHREHQIALQKCIGGRVPEAPVDGLENVALHGRKKHRRRRDRERGWTA